VIAVRTPPQATPRPRPKAADLPQPIELRRPRAKAKAAKAKPAVVVKPNYWTLVEDFHRGQRVNRTAKTISTYHDTFLDFARYLERERISLHLDAIQREHIERYLAELIGPERQLAASTAYTRHANLRAWFRWLIEEGEIEASPMARVKAPKVEEKPPTIISDVTLGKLFATCIGTDFTNRRDMAILRVLLSTGVRRGELCSIRRDQIDLDAKVVQVSGKTGTRLEPLTPKTIEALSRYRRSREMHEHAELAAWWLSPRGAFSADGAYQMVRRRCRQAGVPDLRPHLFRHTWAHKYRMRGGQEGNLMEMGGWRTRKMLDRYGRSAAHERAMDEAQQLKIGDDI
jgi:site-specific recombinase XerD